MRPHQYSRDEIALKLASGRRLEAEGVPMRHLCKTLEVAELTYLRWKRKYGDLDDARSRLFALEEENERLRAMIARLEGAAQATQSDLGRVEAC